MQIDPRDIVGAIIVVMLFSCLQWLVILSP